MVEMLLATLALLVWLRVEPGSVPSVVAYNTLVIGVLTLFVNGNPLLRYDGYYAFSDLIDIPNLAARSRACLAYLVQRYVYGLNDVTSCVADRRERWWLLGYGISSGIFRLVIVTAILWYLLNHYFIIGTLLAVWVTVSYFIGPMLQHTGFLLFSSRLYRRRRRPLCITSGLLVLVLLVSGVIPMPYSTQVQGVVWIPERGQIRAQAEGFVKTVAVAPGEQVDTGQLVVELENPELEMRVALLRAQLDEWQARQLAARNTNLEEVESAGDRIHNLQAAFHEAQQDMQHLKLLSSVNGQVVLPDVTDLPGRYVQRGDLLGYVVTQEPATVRTAIPQKDASLIQSDLQEIRVRLASRPEILPATLVRHTPAAGNRLPSPVLGQPAGGPFAVDPEDRQGVSTTEKFFQVDVQLQKAGELRIGERAWVRLEHSHTPLLKQWYTVLRSLWMGRVQA
jgi:putative peptide zinc metalloprotease protein